MKYFKTMILLLIVFVAFTACDRDPINANKKSGDEESWRKKMPEFPKTKEELLKARDNKTNR